MGEFAKKWVAAIVVALIIVIIAAISIGKMDRNGTTVPPQNVVAQKTAPVRPAVPRPAPDLSRQAATPSSVEPAKIRNEGVGPVATPQTAVEKIPSSAQAHQPVPMRSSVPRNGTANYTSTKPAFQQGQTYVHAAQQQPPAAAAGHGMSSMSQQHVPVGQTQVPLSQVQPRTSAPDIGTELPQQLAPGEIVTATMDVSQWSGLMSTTANVNVNGVFTNVTTLVDATDKIDTPGQNGALITGGGNTIALGTSAQLTL